MALLGSGTSQIQNHVSEGKFTSASVDESVAAAVEQIGGTKWAAGVYSVVPGNINADNLSTAGAKFRNAQKAEPSGSIFLNLSAPDTSTGHTTALMSPVSMRVRSAAVAAAAAFASGKYVYLYVRGAKVATIPAPSASGEFGKVIPLGDIDIRVGDYVYVDLSEVSSPSVAYPNISLAGAAYHEVAP